jgi:hypothetical protein
MVFTTNSARRPFMRVLIAGLTVLMLSAACGAPPSRPESLWDSTSPSDTGGARSVPARIWEGGESGGPTEAADGAEGETPPVEEPEIVGTVVINEIYYDAVGNDTDGLLFVELYGTPGLPVGGFQILFVDGGDGSVDDTIVLPEGVRLPEDGFYVVADARTGAPDLTQVAGADLIDNFDPQNGPDAVQLTDVEGGLLDAVGYGEGLASIAENGLATFEGSPCPDVVNGHSLEREEPGLDTGSNLDDFAERETPTPGEGPVPPAE